MLNPSRYEGFGLIAFEAFLARKPMCATTIVVFLEFLKDRKNAMLVPPGNGEALAGAIQELDANQELRERLVQGGLETAKEFSYERMVNEHIALIEKVFLGETHATPLVD